MRAGQDHERETGAGGGELYEELCGAVFGCEWGCVEAVGGYEGGGGDGVRGIIGEDGRGRGMGGGGGGMIEGEM